MKFSFSAGDRPLEGYTIKRAIHRGGFGEVYYALTDAGKDIALKLLHENQEIELRGVSQCLNLKHPHLVTLFDIKTDAAGDHWVLMEYITGSTLAERIRQAPQGLPIAEVVNLLSQCGQGLQFLHDRGLVHRDLKPANIFLEGDVVKIGDVGLSKFMSPSRRSAHTQSVGTVYYMAPEVAKGQYGRGVDIYAMGVIAYELLTGQVPFDGESTAEILMKHLTAQPDLSKVPPALAPVLAKALAKEENQRYGTVQEFCREFAQAAEGKAAPFVKGQNVNNQTQSEREQVWFQQAAPACRANGVENSSEKRGRGSWWWLVGMLVILAFLLSGPRRGPSPMAFLLMTAAAGYCFYRFNRNTGGPQSQRTTPADRVLKPPPPPVNSAFRTPILTASLRERWKWFLQSTALTPLILALISGTILFFSQNFFSSVSQPNETDPAHVLFFIGSASLATCGLLLLTLLPRRRSEKGRPWLSFGIIGAIVGTGVFGLSEWLMVEYPTHHFSPHQAGLVSRLGRYELAHYKKISLLDHHQLHPMKHEPVVLKKPNPHPARGLKPFHNQYAVPKKEQATLHQADYGSVPEISRDSWSPTLPGYIVFFGLLFVLRSWSRLNLLTRPERFQLSAVALSAGLGYLLCSVFTFPMFWGITWAAAITAVFQLASPCVAPVRAGREFR